MAKICFVVSNPKEIYEQLKSQNLHELSSYTIVTPGAYKFFINYNSTPEAILVYNFIMSINYNVENIRGFEEMKIISGFSSNIKNSGFL